MTEQTTIPEAPANPATTKPSGEWAAFGTAVQFLTRVPWPTSEPASSAALARCPVYFPVVGGLVGIVTSVALGIGCLFWPAWLAVLVALAIEARLTGAFHEDAVADFCDAFGGGWTRDDVLRILKDSRIGSYGALGLGMAVALRAGAMLEIIQQTGNHNWLIWGSAIVASSAIGRFVIVVVMVCVPPVASRVSLSCDIGRQLNFRDLLASTCWMLPFILLYVMQLPVQSMISVAALVPIVVWFMALVRHRLGGMTGDCLGFICYASMIVVLMATAARWNL